MLLKYFFLILSIILFFISTFFLIEKYNINMKQKKTYKKKNLNRKASFIY